MKLIGEHNKNIMILAYRPGTYASIGVIRVLILKACIDDNFNITYEVCWWDGMSRKTEWVIGAEITETEKDSINIGFNI